MFTKEQILANKKYFEDKLRAVKQKADLVRKVKEGTGDFLLLDTRSREAFAQGHIAGAWCAPAGELQVLEASIPRDKELVVYCWNHL